MLLQSTYRMTGAADRVSRVGLMGPAALLPSSYEDDFARAGLPPQEQWPVFNTSGPFAYPHRMNAAAVLLDGAVNDGFGDHIAIVSPGANGTWNALTYHQLQRQVDAIASVLTRDLLLVTGNRVLLRGYNGPMMAAAWLAVLKAGGIAVTTMPMLRARELQTVVQQARCRFALCDNRLSAELEAAIMNCDGLERVCYWGGNHSNSVPPLETQGASPLETQSAPPLETLVAPSLQTQSAPPLETLVAPSLQTLMRAHTTPFPAVPTSSDDVCLIAFTSGTTGVPKGCMHFHRDVMAVCDAFSQSVLRPTSDDRFIGTPPLAFTFGLGALLVFSMQARASTVLLETATPESLLDAIVATRATITATAPTFYRAMSLALVREPHRWTTASLKQSISAGEVLPGSTRALWRDTTGVDMLDGIGATEMMHIFIAASGADIREGAIGKAVPGYDVAVLNDDFEPVPAGVVGKLAVRGPTGCRYLSDPRQQTYVQRGWNLTGDACTMDSDGYVYFKARTDDLIISSGYNIGAPEVEAAILEHEGVAECAVVGVADAERGQCVKAFIVLRPPFTASNLLVRDIQDHVKRTIAPYKYPRIIEFRTSLPRTETGKLQRFRLKADDAGQ